MAKLLEKVMETKMAPPAVARYFQSFSDTQPHIAFNCLFITFYNILIISNHIKSPSLPMSSPFCPTEDFNICLNPRLEGDQASEAFCGVDGSFGEAGDVFGVVKGASGLSCIGSLAMGAQLELRSGMEWVSQQT